MFALAGPGREGLPAGGVRALTIAHALLARRAVAAGVDLVEEGGVRAQVVTLRTIVSALATMRRTWPLNGQSANPSTKTGDRFEDAQRSSWTYAVLLMAVAPGLPC